MPDTTLIDLPRPPPPTTDRTVVDRPAPPGQPDGTVVNLSPGPGGTSDVTVIDDAGCLTVADSRTVVDVIVEPDCPVTVTRDRTAVVLTGERGLPGRDGSSENMTTHRVAARTLSGDKLVWPNDAGELEYADNLLLTHVGRPVWLTTGSTGVGSPADVVTFGPVTNPAWAWVPGEPLFLGHDGALTQVPPEPADGSFQRQVAEAETPTRIFFNPEHPIAYDQLAGYAGGYAVGYYGPGAGGYAEGYSAGYLGHPAGGYDGGYLTGYGPPSS